MPAIESTLSSHIDPQLVQIIEAAPMMPLNDSLAYAAGYDSGIHQPTIDAIKKWLKSQPVLSQPCLSGLWLLAGDLDRSHTISQSIETIDGSYWHGIMHRREGDYFNAKYWMRRTSGHPVTEQLKRQLPDYRDATSFVDLVEQAVQRDHSLREQAEQMQWLEWQLLFAHCL